MDPNLVNIVDLKDVSYVSALADRNVLIYNNAAISKKWENKPITDIAAQSVNGGMEKVVKQAITTSSYTINLANGNVFFLTLNANTTIYFPTVANNYAISFTLYTQQGATARTLNWQSGKVKWAGGTVANVSNTANAVDCFVFETVNGGTTWYGSLVGKNFS